MTRVPERVVALAALALPYEMRARYREQWQADVRDARAAGMSRTGIAIGAALFSLTAARTAEAYGFTVTELALRRVRWGVALVLSSGVLFVGLWTSGGFGSRGGIPQALSIAVFALVFAAVVVGFWLLWRAAAAVGRVARLATAVVGLAVVAFLAGAAVLALAPLAPFAALIGAIAAIAVPVAVIAGIAAKVSWLHGLSGSEMPLSRRTPRRMPVARRRVIAVSVFGGVFAVIALGLVDALVWGPQSQAPGHELSVIYAAVAEDSGAVPVTMIAVWAGFWTLAAVAFLLVTVVPRYGSFARALTPRRIVIVGLALASTIVFFQGWATFSIGMSIADTLPPNAGTRSGFWSVYAATGSLLMVAAILGSVPPAAPGLQRALA